MSDVDVAPEINLSSGLLPTLVCEGRRARHAAYTSSFYCLFICKPKKLFDFACPQNLKKEKKPPEA